MTSNKLNWQTIFQPILARKFQTLYSTLALCMAAIPAAGQNINFMPCDNAASHTISAPLNVPIAVNIGALSPPAGNLSWAYDATPNGFNGVTCSGDPVNCNGVIITLPAAAPASQVTLTGTPTSGAGGFNMALEATVGVTSCVNSYLIDFIDPFQTVLVLDRSGSMGSSSNVVAPATSRWNALHLSVNNFSTHFIDAGDEANSELGVSLFNGNVVANNSFNAGLQVIEPALSTQLDTELVSQSPGGSTAMGKGVQNALTKFTNPARPRSVLLFTDGEQNVSPFVDVNPGNGSYLNSSSSSLSTITPCNAAGPNCVLIPADIKFVTIGIGQPSAPYLTTLMDLAAQQNGFSIITSSSNTFTYGNGMALGDVASAFTNAIAPVLSTNSPQMVAHATGQLIGTNPVTLPAFDLNRFLQRIVLQISYSSRFETPQLATLLAGIRVEKDGVDVTPYFTPTIVGNFSDSIILKSTFSLPGSGLSPINSTGNYVVKMVKSANIKDLDFKVVAFADDHLFDMNWQVSPKAPKVTEDFQPQITLAWQGQPIESATAMAFILKPGDDLGDLLANYGAQIDASTDVDAGTAGYQKYLALLENDPNFLAQLLPSEQNLSLSHQGGGVYSSTYNPGDISGVYQVLYTVNYNSPETDTIQRLAMQSVYVRFGDLDAANSNITTAVQGNTTTITMKPISIVGKLIGPGQQDAFSFIGTDLTIASVTDHQDGRYTYVINGDPNQSVSINLLGDTIFTGALQNFGGQATTPTPPIPQWLLWLILLLIVVILLIWVLRKLFGSSTTP